MKRIEQAIEEKLCEIERREGVKILYAVESGSRAWGWHRRIVITMCGLFMYVQWKIILGLIR